LETSGTTNELGLSESLAELACAPQACESLSGLTILGLATQEWDAHWTPVQQVLLRLAPRNRVIYFEPFHPPFRWLKKQKRTRHGLDQVAQLREISDNLFVYRPRSLYAPGNMRWGISQRYNSPIYAAEIRQLLRRMGAARPWLWAFFAQSLSVLSAGFARTIYDCVDDWPSFFPHGSERRFVARIDEQLCRRSDLVFVGSEPLLRKKAGRNLRTFVVNHAADIAHFARARHPETAIPKDLASIPHPRIGFIGMIDNVRFDADLVRRAAETTSHHVVLIGGFMPGAQGLLAARPNVHQLGMKTIAELPAYLKGLDVCLMPYKLNEATRNIFPLKLFEYMAAGKPIVATAIPAVMAYRDLLHVSGDPDSFIQLIERAIAEDDPNLVARRIECASQHTWEAHVAQKTDLVRRYLLPA
jgi:glycosyltransferase involved in cell wall biosynthesis